MEERGRRGQRLGRAVMQDSFGRTIDYLRVSVTDRCNLRCVYCMPEEGVRMTTHEMLLSYDEIVRICRIMAAMGVRKIKLTGGEPLARRNLPALVSELKKLDGIEKVTLTTNGVLLGEYAEALVQAGLDAVNVSLDTMDRELYCQITRRDELERVLESLRTLQNYPELPVKINCVPLGNDAQKLAELASFAKEQRVHVRYIEMMPVGYGKEFTFIGEEEIRRLLEETCGPLEPYHGRLGNGPCQYYQIEGFQGKIGFISAISHKFCEECNRVRLTSQGFLKTCLQYDTGRDLRTLLRGGKSDTELAEAIREAVKAKPGSHHFLEHDVPEENSMCMSQIGG